MYTGSPGLQGFFLFDAVKSAGEFVIGGVKEVFSAGQQTGSTTPVYVQTAALPQSTMNYTPWLIGGAAVLGVLLLSKRGRR
jgi:hypothetical protein